MTKTIKNLNELSRTLEFKIKQILDAVAKDVKKEIADALNRYYDEYNPALGKRPWERYYHRTDQLRNCCKISKIKKNGNKVSIDIYLDIDSLNYTSNGADARKTLVSAASGLHGGFDISNISAGQVPWNTIKNYDGAAYGSGTQIWEEPINELFGDEKLITMFKKHAKTHGLNIK